MTGDYKEKYYRINLDWPEKAGKMNQVLATQKRLITKLSKSKQSQDVAELLVSVGEGYDVATDLMDWMRKMLTGVAQDATALCEGSTVRNQLKWNSELLGEMLDTKHNRIDELINEIRERHK